MGMHTIYLSLGSNKGDRVANLREAVRQLRDAFDLRKAAHLYAASPTESTYNASFINTVVCVTTELRPFDALAVTKSIEQRLGHHSIPYVPRTIDIDMLYYDSIQMETMALCLPHPKIAHRVFVLKPLAEIAPNFMHPVLYFTSLQLLQNADDVNEVQVYTPQAT